jgi:2-methylaconitate cis-trans-isomerase PrpF
LLQDKYWRQLDGLGAGISSLSKVCVISPTTHSAADVDYTFAAVGVGSSDVDFHANCGNMSSAIGPFAYNHGLVPRGNQDSVTVRIHNTNTRKIIHSTFNVTGDRQEAATSGQCTIAGVPGTGAEIKLAFLDPVGSKTGALLPTGNVVDMLDGIEVSCIDAATPCAFVRAADLGVSGFELPDELSNNIPLLWRLEELRRLAAQSMGLCQQTRDTPRAIPKIALISKPAKHLVLSGEELEEDNLDVIARVMSDRQPHRAIPLTAALCMAVAATVKGSVVESLLRPKKVKDGALTIGHPSGAIEVSANQNRTGKVQAANVFRTARPVMEGVVFY